MVAHPFVYEINTWAWLDELSRRERARRSTSRASRTRSGTRSRALGFDAVWLMGVWQRSPAGIAIALANAALVESFAARAARLRGRRTSSGRRTASATTWSTTRLGGADGLAVGARRRSPRRGLGADPRLRPQPRRPRPSVGRRAPGVLRPRRRRRTSSATRRRSSRSATASSPTAATRTSRRGRTSSSSTRSRAGLRGAVAATLRSIADQCDGVRCDMAMLMMNDVFARTWGGRAAGHAPETRLLADGDRGRAGRSTRSSCSSPRRTGTWSGTLQQQGFDYCYDKRLYDRLVHEGAEQVRGHLGADLAYQRRLLRFVENHDEPRAAATFPGAARRARPPWRR